VTNLLEKRNPDSLRRNNFDVIRLVLAVLVIFSHSYPLATGSESEEPFAVFTRAQTTAGAMAVDLFFVISGFLIARSFARSSSIWSYMGKRFRRIYPGFITVSLLSALVICRGRISPADFILQTARLQEFGHGTLFPGNPFPDVLNGSLWSIQYEFWCYIGLALLGLTGLLRQKSFLLSLFLLSLAASFLFRIHNWRPGGGFAGHIFGYPPYWVRLLPLFMAGVIFNAYADRISLNWKVAVFLMFVIVVSAVRPYWWTIIFPLAGTYLIMWLAFHPRIEMHGFANQGDLSYGTYLYAFPIQQTVVHLAGRGITPLALFLYATPVALLFAFLSWHLVEKRFLALKIPKTRKPKMDKLALANR
jgi:peptidoglycan/LPS O-acetylase OafA/YrhL